MPRGWCELKLLVITETLGRGGAEQALVNLLPALVEQGCRCEVAVLHPPYTLADEIERAGVVVHRLDMAHRWVIPQGIARVARVLRRGGYDVAHGHLFFSGLYLALTKPLVPRVTRVVTFHNLGYDSFPATTAWRRLRKALDSWLMRHWIDRHVAVSQAVATHYGAHLRLPGVTVVHNAFPVAQMQATPTPGRDTVRAQFALGPDEFVLLVCGRLIPEKGHRYFLEALAVLRQRGLRPKALIVGDGPLRDDIARDIAARDLGSQVQMPGVRPLGELLGIMGACDLLVMPSTHEGFPLTPGEAMAVGLPVLASRVGGIPELVEDGRSGRLIPPADVTALADAIEALYRDSNARRQLATEALQRIDHFSAPRMAARWLEYYRSWSATSSAAPECC